MTLINDTGVALTTDWHLVRCRAGRQLFPSVSCKVETPQIVQLLIIVVLSTKNVHVFIIGNRWVTCSGAWLFIWAEFNEIPLSTLKVKPVECVDSVTILSKTSENQHLVIMHDGGVFIADWGLVHVVALGGLGPYYFPDVVRGVECVESFIWLQAGAATEQVHLVFINHWAMVRNFSY